MYLICQQTDIEDRDAKGFETPVGDIIVAQRDGQFFAYQNICPHLQVNLEYIEDEFMDMDKEYLICANHGALFQVEDGYCVWGPCQDESLQPVAIQLAADGGIYLAAQDA